MEQVRPFCKIISVATNASGQLGLYDSKGNPFFCDTIQVTPAMGSASGVNYFWVQPSGIRNSTVSLNSDASSTTLSGAYGKVGTPGIPLLLELGPGADACSALNIVNRIPNGPVTFLVNYGIRRETNIIRSMTVSGGL